jgi:hypothetical protein
MQKKCWAPECRPDYAGQPVAHTLSATKDPAMLRIWNCCIPREGTLLEKCCIHFQDIVNEMFVSNILTANAVGCNEHSTGLTTKCIQYYIVIKIYYLQRSINKNRKSS